MTAGRKKTETNANYREQANIHEIPGIFQGARYAGIAIPAPVRGIYMLWAGGLGVPKKHCRHHYDYNCNLYISSSFPLSVFARALRTLFLLFFSS